MKWCIFGPIFLRYLKYKTSYIVAVHRGGRSTVPRTELLISKVDRHRRYRCVNYWYGISPSLILQHIDIISTQQVPSKSGRIIEIFFFSCITNNCDDN